MLIADLLILKIRISNPSHFNQQIRIFWIWIHLKMHYNSKFQSGNLSTTLLTIGFRNYRENDIKTRGNKTRKQIFII